MSSRNILKHTANTFSPGDPSLGDEWYDTSNSRLYKYLAVNGTSPQWVELYSASSNGGLTLPSWSNNTRPVGRTSLGYNNTTNCVEFYNNKIGAIPPQFNGSLQFNGSNQYLSVSSSPGLNFGTGDFTIEAWFYWPGTAPSNTNQYTILSNVTTNDNTTWDLQYYNGNWRFSSWSPTFLQGANSSFLGDTWNHIAVTRASGVGQIWLNGSSVTGPVSFTTNLNSQYVEQVGYNGYNNYWNGFITNLRVVKGTSIYNSAFTPTGPLLNVTNTTLLLSVSSDANKIVDSSTTPLTLTNVNGVTYSTLAPSVAASIGVAGWINIQRRPTAFEYLIVGGGAGGGAGYSTNARGGGGGAGGVVYGNFQNYLTGSSTFTVIVGGGGAGLAANTAGVGGTGTNTSISGPTSTTTSLAALLTDRSTNAFTVTNNGGVSVVSTSTYGNYSGSLSFNGTSQYLSIPTNDALNFGTGDFTVEAWVNTTAANAGDFFIISATGSGGFFFGYNSAAASYGWGRAVIAWDYNIGATKTNGVWQHIAVSRSGTSMRIFVNGVQAGTTQLISTAYDLGVTSTVVGWQASTYYFPGYISNLRIVKGVAVYTTTTNIPIAPLAVTQPASGNINAISAGQTSFLLGVNNNYLSVIGAGGGGGSSWDVRLGGISGGSGGGGYTASPAISNISTSTQRSIYGYGLGNPGSTGSVYSAVSGAGGGGGAGGAAISGLATGKGGDGGIGTNLYSSILESVSMGVRSTSGVFVSTVSNVTLYGPATGSLQFNGTSHYLSVPDQVGLNMGADNFTIEAWIYLLATPGASGSGIVYKRATSAVFGGVGLGFTAAVLTPTLLATVNGTTWGITINSSIAVAVGAWAHVAVTRSGNVFTLWVDGVSGGTVTVAGTIPTNTAALTVGAVAADGSFPFNGYITNVRIIKSIALYTSSFTRTVPLTGTTNTQLLLLVPSDLNKVFDSSTVTNTVTNSGATFSTFIPSTSTNVSVFSGAGNYYIAGGGGGGGSAVPGLGGIGGGGDGANITQDGYNGIVYTGGGGGGGGGASAAGGNGGSGGSGVVIIRHLDAYTTGTISTGSARVVVSGGYRNYVFTSSGVISF